MAGDNICSAINSVFISTGGRPVIPDTCSSQPILAVEFIPTRAPVISETSSVPNIFPALVTRDNPLRQRYDRDVQANPSEEYDHRHPCDAPLVTPPSFHVFE